MLQIEGSTAAHTLSNLVHNLEILHATQRFAEPVGHVVEATNSGYKVEGLSKFVSLGSLVKILNGDISHLAEVVRVDVKSALVRPFSSHGDIRLATKVIPAGDFGIRQNARGGRVAFTGDCQQ